MINKVITHKIGLEIHVRLKTQTKLFSKSENNFSHSPNTFISSYDFAFPGFLPQINQKVVELGIQACFLFDCKIADLLSFDRKNYYYFDLPKGYQITQFYNPLGKDGYLKIYLPNDRFKTIRIQSIIIEEDTAKSLHFNDHVLVDYNRCGTPLLEIVTCPDFENFMEVEIFLQKLMRVLKRSNISDVDFSLGFIRVDVNLSTNINHQGDCKITEIKNLNSLKAIKNALLLEKKWQIKNYSKIDIAVTKNWDQKTKTLKIMRHKFSRFDYFFAPENNLAPYNLTSIFKQKIINQVIDKYLFEITKINKYNLSFLEMQWLFDHENLLKEFQNLHSFKINKKGIFYLLKEIVHPFLMKQKVNFPHQFFKTLLQFLQKSQINLHETKTLFWKLFDQDNYLLKIKNFIIKKKEIAKSSFSIEKIQVILIKIIKEDVLIKDKFLKKQAATERYLIGQIMKITKGKASKKMILEAIKNVIALK